MIHRLKIGVNEITKPLGDKKRMSLLQLTPVTFTDKLLEIKVQNLSSSAALDKRLVIEISPPAHLVNEKIIEGV